MTDEEKRLLESARALLALTGTTDPAAAEATVRALVDSRATNTSNVAELERVRGELNAQRRETLLNDAVRDARLAPRSEWTDEQKSYLDSLSALAPEGQRSPLESYLRTLSPRVNTAPRELPKSGPGASQSRSILPGLMGGDEKASPYLERARTEKSARTLGRAVV